MNGHELYVYGRLRKLVHPGLAYLLAGGAFAAHHYVVLASFFSGWMTVCLGTCVGMGGVLWCWLYQKQDSLMGCWISHMLVDGVILYIGFKIIN
jgi:membrane protease YdiL (CAAX protease family)